MQSFKTSKIIQNNTEVALAYREARRAKKMTLADAAQKAGINHNYLRAIEDGNFKKLPSGLYQTKYLKEYAIFLGINHKELIENLVDNGYLSKEKDEKLFSQKTVKTKTFIIPKILKNAVIMGAVIVCFVYLFNRFENVITPPKLQIINPNENLITDDHSLKVIGTTESETQIIINGNQVLSDINGSFAKMVNLRSGINTIIITAKKKFGRENTIVKQVLVKELN